MHRESDNLNFDTNPVITSYASIAGKKEAEGPLRESFDSIIYDSYAGKNTFEQAESELMTVAVNKAIEKAGIEAEDIDIAYCGDLLNQCVASSFAMRGFNIPYAGIYGACSTMGLGLIMSAISVEGGAFERALCAASSHYCTAERQYRFPLEYGSQRPPTAQWTVTGAGACLVESAASKINDRSERLRSPYIKSARIGRITDLSVTDQNNMGAAMAPAVVKIGTKNI